MTPHVASMLQTHPKDLGTIDQQKLAEGIEACFECAQTSTACADACLAEDMVEELTQCIRLNQDCADVCAVTGRVLSRQTGNNVALNRALLEACQAACRSCAEECAKHADMHEHCTICADARRRCEQACAELLASIG
ncbi:four-helix bundle copper-binding protein [Brachybacterium sp. P6-10-X1]|uniref:four-helix bundle copper-binding protein n=1 Tax=Brachybacterium sp. P6-10-X1 TaxID=1903186 RepID=UPI0009719B2A|nr:four-helix bundle copper-binding protein [Brachybacterium sp. P6-10-X1]APX31824.1 four-helix bundle copper-binding protein [Brachybacterium sp. P6-10-X1]